MRKEYSLESSMNDSSFDNDVLGHQGMGAHMVLSLVISGQLRMLMQEMVEGTDKKSHVDRGVQP